MKRSEINAILEDAVAFIDSMGFKLPPFAYWSPAEWAEGERVLVGEVSMVNDDVTDNRFYLEMGRFPTVEEDEPALYLLGNE